MILAIVLLQSRLTRKAPRKEFARWISASQRLRMSVFVIVSSLNCVETVRMIRALVKATGKFPFPVRLFEYFECTCSNVFGKIIHTAGQKKEYHFLVTLADGAELSWVIFNLVSMMFWTKISMIP